MDHIDLDATYPHPPERVWRALTEASALSRWLMPTDFKPALGARFSFDDLSGARKRTIACEVVELEPGRRLVYTWSSMSDVGNDEEEPPSVVAWTLKPTDSGGTHVRIEHQPLESPAPHVLIELGMNWRHAMSSSLPVMLRALLAQARPPVPIVYVEEDQEIDVKRVAGLTRREEATCG